MKKYASTGRIKILGTVFDSVGNIIAHANSWKPKGKVYAGEDLQRHPCFDSEDYMYENRYYHNFVFTKSKAELDTKLSRLKSMKQTGCRFRTEY